MPPKAQAYRTCWSISTGVPHALAALGLAASMAGCAGGPDLDRLGADPSIITGSVNPQTPTPGDSAESSDEAQIRATILSWAPGVIPDDKVPWINLDTGSAGAIVKTEDFTKDGDYCRKFTATRESFDGVGAWRGEACNVDAAFWRVNSLEML